MPAPAEFSYVPTLLPDAVLIVDLDHYGCLSVTNDAEAVVLQVLKRHPGRRIIYCDTEKSWEELLHDGTRFTGFMTLSNHDYARFSPWFNAVD